MPLLNAGNLMLTIRANRFCWFMGRVGGGKTSLAVRLALELLETKVVDHVISNCAVVFADDIETLKIEDPKTTNTCFVLDEGGIYLKNGRKTDTLLTAMRKMNTYLLVPSMKPPAYDIRAFKIQRMVDLSKIGLPLAVYRWKLNMQDIRESEVFGWLRPSEIYGTYDTEDMPIDDQGVIAWLKELQDRLVREAYARKGKQLPSPKRRKATSPEEVLTELVYDQEQPDEFFEDDNLDLILEAAQLQNDAAEKLINHRGGKGSLFSHAFGRG